MPVTIGQLNYAFIGKWFHELNTQGVRELSKMTSTKEEGGGQHYTQPMSGVKKRAEYQRTDAPKVWIADMSADGMAFYRKRATVQMKHEQLQQWERFGEKSCLIFPSVFGFWKGRRGKTEQPIQLAPCEVSILQQPKIKQVNILCPCGFADGFHFIVYILEKQRKHTYIYVCTCVCVYM